MAPIALRRWQSSGRRKIAADDLDGRINDLAKGLFQHFETLPPINRPLMLDYRDLAKRIAAALSAEEKLEPGSQSSG